MNRLGTFLTIGFVALALPVAAHAQSSGGSFGSSDWGGGGSSSSSSSSSSSGSSSWDDNSSSGGGGPGIIRNASIVSLPSGEYGERYVNGSPGAVTVTDAETAAADTAGALAWIASVLCSFVFFSLVFGFATFVFGRDRYAAPTGPYEVRQITVAFDWTMRRAIQAQLSSMASRFGSGAAGRQQASREAVRVLQEACGSARYAAFETYRGKAQKAQERFQSIAMSLRARYKHEMAGARASGSASAVQARADEGEGLVVVSVVVAWDAHLGSLPNQLNPEAAAAALQTLVPRAGANVIALEVIWSPAQEQDRLSSAELEQLYPELQRLDARGDVGRMGCTYCRAVFPRELGACPACGAPADAAPTRAANA